MVIIDAMLLLRYARMPTHAYTCFSRRQQRHESCHNPCAHAHAHAQRRHCHRVTITIATSQGVTVEYDGVDTTADDPSKTPYEFFQVRQRSKGEFTARGPRFTRVAPRRGRGSFFYAV